MSNWTHVAAVARIDSICGLMPEMDFEKLFGKGISHDSPDKAWKEYEEHPERFLPCGSEGSLKVTVWTNPDSEHIARYDVMVYGDLRDHDDPQAIADWFKEKLKSLWVRQATITVQNEWHGTVNWTYEMEEESK